jgi:hypothetical protein
MTRREVLLGLAALALPRLSAEKTEVPAALVLVRTGEGHFDLCMVRHGIEVARTRMTVIDPAVWNDVELAEGIRQGLKAWGDEEMPIFVAEEGEYVKGFVTGLRFVS